MKKSILLTLVLVLGLTTMSLAIEYIWAQKADMPTARFLHSASVVDGKIYVIGGTAKDMTEAIFPVEVYDPVMDEWTTEANIPAPRAAHSASVVDGKIYVIGGAESPTVLHSTVLEYDPAEDTWTTKSDMSTARWFFSTSVVNGKIYAIGGVSSLTNLVGLSTVEVYDPVTDTWTSKANMPFGVWNLRTTVVDGKIYVLGGRPYGQARPYVQEYDPATDTWTRKSDMPLSTGGMGSAVLGDKIIVIGGWLHSGNYPYKAVQMYDPETDIWTIEGDAPFRRASFSASVVNNRIYAIGGTDRPHPLPATSTVYELTVSGPTPDFNGDGIVDAADMCMMVDYWGTDEPSYDIAPPPFGDGIVDVQDLIVLAEHLFDDCRAIAQWKLDEKAGDIAYDSVGGYDGILHGEPIWQPTGGQVCGTLEFDGIDDYIETDFVLNPAGGAFSVFAWIKGSAPGQVIISQIDSNGAGEIWLGTDALSGNLITGLVPKKIGWVTPRPLISESVITDIQWHHIGFVWDGSYRILYADGIEVAKDTAPQNPLKSATGGLYIGAGKILEVGTLFSGLIDDVRVYNVALTAEQIAALTQ